LVINGTTLGEYAGQNRNVVFAASSHMVQNMSGTMYWDRQTGVLVEVVAFVDGNAYSSMKITETNLWGYSLQSMITLHFPFLLLFAFCLLVIAFLTILFFRTSRALVDFPAGSHGLQRTATRGSQEEGSSLKQFARNLLERAGIVYLKVSKILLGLSLIFLVMGILLLTSERQWYSSFSFAAAVCCFVTGLALHFEEWTLGSLGGRIGSFMVYSSVLIMAVGLLTGAYREVGACVPYTSVFAVGPNMLNIGTAIVIERVYINPYSAFSSFMATVGFCLFFVGVLLKLRHGY
jgi:hypothetical protein